jgi:chorismate mutase
MGKNNKKIIVAGPCAIETKSGLLSIVKHIHNHVNIIRAGVWKARTLPKNYSGRGSEALKWIEYVQHRYNIPFAIEVGTKTHVELALKYNIKIFWIGARTTSNPFAVQEIADSLSNLDVEIWIKNPIFSNIDLWFGAIKRFQLNKITKIKVIHRGFYEENEEKYRNSPRWDLLDRFRNRYPSIPIICDPSHIAGKRDLIYQTSKKALQENVDGLMIEVHHNPNKALSDKDQQLSPLEFETLLTQLKLK